MRVFVLDSRRTIHEGDAKKVILPCDDGEMCVLDFHQPFVCSLVVGSLRVDKGWEKEIKAIPIKKGIAKMTGNELVCIISRSS